MKFSAKLILLAMSITAGSAAVADPQLLRAKCGALLQARSNPEIVRADAAVYYAGLIEGADSMRRFTGADFLPVYVALCEASTGCSVRAIMGQAVDQLAADLAK